MRKGIVVLSVLAAILVFAAVPVLAEQAKTLEIEKIDVVAYDKMHLQELYGVDETIALDDVILLALFFDIKPPWTDAVDKVRVNSKAIQLVSGIDTYGVVGYFDYINQFRFTSARSLNMSRPSKWKENPENILFNVVYAVPGDKEEVEFRMGEMVTKIKTPEDISPPPSPADLVSIEVIGGKLHDRIQNEYHLSNLKPNPLSTAKTLGGGKILQVKIKITPKRANTWKNYFYQPNMVFSLVSDSGALLRQIGQFSGKRLYKTTSNNLYERNGKWQTKEVDLYFGAPSDIKSFKLYYFWDEVGEGAPQ